VEVRIGHCYGKNQALFIGFLSSGDDSEAEKLPHLSCRSYVEMCLSCYIYQLIFTPTETNVTYGTPQFVISERNTRIEVSASLPKIFVFATRRNNLGQEEIYRQEYITLYFQAWAHRSIDNEDEFSDIQIIPPFNAMTVNTTNLGNGIERKSYFLYTTLPNGAKMTTGFHYTSTKEYTNFKICGQHRTDRPFFFPSIF